MVWTLALEVTFIHGIIYSFSMNNPLFHYAVPVWEALNVKAFYPPVVFSEKGARTMSKRNQCISGFRIQLLIIFKTPNGLLFEQFKFLQQWAYNLGHANNSAKSVSWIIRNHFKRTWYFFDYFLCLNKSLFRWRKYLLSYLHFRKRTQLLCSMLKHADGPWRP